MTRPDSSPGVNRRSVVAGSAWAVPAIIAATSAPAFAASRCAGGFNKYSWTVGWYGLTGIAGYINDAHFWIKAFETPTPPRLPAGPGHRQLRRNFHATLDTNARELRFSRLTGSLRNP